MAVFFRKKPNKFTFYFFKHVSSKPLFHLSNRPGLLFNFINALESTSLKDGPTPGLLESLSEKQSVR